MMTDKAGEEANRAAKEVERLSNKLIDEKLGRRRYSEKMFHSILNLNNRTNQNRRLQ